jgi:cob(I)alamin adenosyltransferase
MPRLTKIYTRTGDDGTTALGIKERVPKDHPRVEAYGTVDELNALLGLALAYGLDIRLHHTLRTIQNELFHLGADLSFPQTGEKKTAVPRVEQRHVDALEELIDEINEGLPSLDNFILPGGTQGAAVLQVARAVCRRTERLVVTLAKEEDLNPLNVIYLNRLSDALFVMARFENLQKGAQEPLWDSQA